MSLQCLQLAVPGKSHWPLCKSPCSDAPHPLLSHSSLIFTLFFQIVKKELLDNHDPGQEMDLGQGFRGSALLHAPPQLFIALPRMHESLNKSLGSATTDVYKKTSDCMCSW